MRKVLFLVLLGVSVVVLAGCASETRAHPKPIDLKDVPPNILKVAQETLPDVNFDAALMKPNGTYEIRGKAPNGKLREVDIRPDGSIEEIE